MGKYCLFQLRTLINPEFKILLTAFRCTLLKLHSTHWLPTARQQVEPLKKEVIISILSFYSLKISIGFFYFP